MSLSSVGYPPWETIRGVQFAMLDGPILVPVLVTQEALDDIERGSPEVAGHLGCFGKHRDAIEQAASAKHQRGQLEGNGAVLVQAGDLNAG